MKHMDTEETDGGIEYLFLYISGNRTPCLLKPALLKAAQLSAGRFFALVGRELASLDDTDASSS